MNTNLYKEIHSLKLDQKDIAFMKMIKSKYKDEAVPIQGRNPDGSLRPVFHNYKNYYLKDCPTDYSEHPIFKKIAFLCRNTEKHSDYKYVYIRFHLAVIPGSLPYHIDTRECVLTIPFNPIICPITWADENKDKIMSYDYDCPVLVNTKVHHGCLENDRERMMCQVGFNEPFEQIAKIIS